MSLAKCKRTGYFCVIPPFLSVSEVARLLSVTDQTVRNSIHAGDLKATRIGATYRVPIAAFEERYGVPVDRDELERLRSESR